MSLISLAIDKDGKGFGLGDLVEVPNQGGTVCGAVTEVRYTDESCLVKIDGRRNLWPASQVSAVEFDEVEQAVYDLFRENGATLKPESVGGAVERLREVFSAGGGAR